VSVWDELVGQDAVVAVLEEAAWAARRVVEGTDGDVASPEDAPRPGTPGPVAP